MDPSTMMCCTDWCWERNYSWMSYRMEHYWNCRQNWGLEHWKNSFLSMNCRGLTVNYLRVLNLKWLAFASSCFLFHQSLKHRKGCSLRDLVGCSLQDLAGCSLSAQSEDCMAHYLDSLDECEVHRTLLFRADYENYVMMHRSLLEAPAAHLTQCLSPSNLYSK